MKEEEESPPLLFTPFTLFPTPLSSWIKSSHPHTFFTPPPHPLQMKDLSFFLFKNSVGASMRKGIKTFCNGDTSTSTLSQQRTHLVDEYSAMAVATPVHGSSREKPRPPTRTLEEMILQLEVEEEIARKAKLREEFNGVRGRMSCVNNSDILRSAKNALNQYPRFSLDGKDAMYRSFGLRGRFHENEFDFRPGKTSLCLPTTLEGESVVWCEPGVVAKLMGLEAMPVPARSSDGRQKLSSAVKKQTLRIRAERQARGRVGSCSSKTGYCVMKPVVQL